MEITINSAIPACVECSAGLKKIIGKQDIRYICPDCGCLYTVISIGITDNEVICEKHGKPIIKFEGKRRRYE